MNFLIRELELDNLKKEIEKVEFEINEIDLRVLSGTRQSFNLRFWPMLKSKLLSSSLRRKKPMMKLKRRGKYLK